MNPSIRRVVLASLLQTTLLAGTPSPAGLRLGSFYDSMDVEHHWLKGKHIDWRTGDPDNGKDGKTYCSAFVASACDRLKLEILRPPAHGQKNLANAQYKWLSDSGKALGWSLVGSPYQAQHLANEGQVVVVIFRNPNSRKSGHIALVRPSDKPDSRIHAEGPQIVQAGGANYASTSVAVGFQSHPAAWVDADHFQVRFFAHPSPRVPDQ